MKRFNHSSRRRKPLTQKFPVLSLLLLLLIAVLNAEDNAAVCNVYFFPEFLLLSENV